MIAASPVSGQAPSEAPREVKIGLIMVSLSEVRGAEQAFSADVFLLATWHDPELAGGSDELRTLALGDVWHPTLLIYNQRSLSASMPEEVTVQPDGTVTYLQRYLGLFAVPMDLREFPMDRQDFYVWLVAPVRAGPAVTLVPDESLAALRAEDLSISDWSIGEPTLTVMPFQVAPGAPSNPGIRLTVPGTRLLTYYTVQVVIPLVAIVLMAWSVFWIAPSVVPTRVGVLVTTMLTLIAYRFMLANYVPRLPYLTRLDWFMVGATILVVLTLFTMAASAYLVRHQREGAVNTIDRVGRVVYPVSFALYSLIVFLR
jgi:hypothetical protein